MRPTPRLHPLESAVFGLIIGLLALAPAASVEPRASICETPIRDEADIAAMKEDLRTEVISTRRSDVLLGVDALGRIAMGVDSDQDGIAERILLFTGQDRLEGPWSKYLENAFIAIHRGTVVVASRQENFGLSLAVSVADAPTLPGWVNQKILHDGGRELVHLFGEPATVAMAALDHNSIQSWPESLWEDLLSPAAVVTLDGCERQCCEDGMCDAGGAPSTSCNIAGCSGTPPSCTVSGCGGTVPNKFACCQCMPGGNANCRCKSCTCGACQ